MNAVVAVRPARAEDWPRIEALLGAAHLPTEDLAPASTSNFHVALDHGRVVGAVAVEPYGDDGLLRSLVVDPAWRGGGIGRALVVRAEEGARSTGLTSLTLLTQTAGPLFDAMGYADIARGDAPAALRSTAEFTHLCPGSRRCMTKRLITE